MRATHFVSAPVNEGKRVSITIGYGTDYAIYVHERSDLAHPVGTDHWLKLTLQEMAPRLPALVARNAKKAFEMGLDFHAIPATAPTAPQDPGASSSSAKGPARGAPKEATSSSTAIEPSSSSAPTGKASSSRRKRKAKRPPGNGGNGGES